MRIEKTIDQFSADLGSFWTQCETEFDLKIGPVLEYLSSRATRLGATTSELEKLERLLRTQNVKDPATLHHLVQTGRQTMLLIEQGNHEAPDAPVSLMLPDSYLPAESDLRRMVDQVTQRLKVVVDPILDQLSREATQWLEARERAKSDRSRREVELARQADAHMASIKEVSSRMLSDAAEQVRNAEAQFESKRVATNDGIPQAPPRSATGQGVGRMLLASGVVALAGGVWLFGTSATTGGAAIALGAVLSIVGTIRSRGATKPDTPPTGPSVTDAGEIRRKVREISEAAERSASDQVAEIRENLRRVRKALDDLPAREREANVEHDKANAVKFEKLLTSNRERIGKLIEALRSVFQQWEKLSRQNQESVLARWKRGIDTQVSALNSIGDSNRGTQSGTAVSVALGRTKYDPPAKLRPYVGNTSIFAPFMLNLEGPPIVLQSQQDSDTVETSAVNIKLLLELAVASHGKLQVRLWDPRNLGANYGRLLELVQTKSTLLYAGRALATARELEEGLAALQGLAADRLALLARRKQGSWADIISESRTSDDDLQVFVASGFPSGFTESSLATLQSIAVSGQRCGIYILLDLAPLAEMSTLREQIKRETTNITRGARVIQVLSSESIRYGDQIISCDVGGERLTERAMQSLRQAVSEADVEVKALSETVLLGDFTFESFRQTISAEKGWTEKSTNGLEVHLGFGLNDQLGQNIRFDNTTPHALMLGGTGSGKSNLLHSVIQGIGLDYSPLEVSFYLADLKDGVEFSRYAQSGRLPHAAAIAATADPRYAVALVKAASEELTRRNKLFIEAECANFERYRSIPHVTLPRILVVIDEFQVLFEDRESALGVKTALINLCKKGRSAGIHLLLASQSLKGKAGDIDEVLGLIQIRILMKIAEGDARRAVADSEMAMRVVSKCTRRGLGCVDTEFGAGEERYFRNPFVDDDGYFFRAVLQYSRNDGSATLLDEEPVIWKDDPRQLQFNPQFSRLEKESRQILVGEPYSIDHAIGFALSRDRAELIAMASASPVQQLSILNSILESAAKTCSAAIRITVIRSSDAVLDSHQIKVLFKSRLGEVNIFEVPQISEALSGIRAGFLDAAAVDGAALHLVVILGCADLTGPKRSAFSTGQIDKSVLRSDIETIGELLAADSNGRLQFLIACRSPLNFLDQLSLIRDRISIKIFGSAGAGSRLRDFVGQPELMDLKPQDMGILRSGDIGALVFKPFRTDVKVA